MKKTWASAAGKALVFFLVCTVLFGGVYTLLCTGLAQLLFPHQANGSIIEVDGKKYGSALLAQEFTGEQYLWGRIMNVDTSTFTDDEGNPVMYAAPLNKTPAGEELEALVAQRVEKLRAANPEMNGAPIPVELVTCSGSGLDPEISPAAAEYQVGRLAKARGMSEDEIRAVVERYTTGRFLGLIGEERVNVLKVNLALDGILEG